jgi:phosphonopyruvate decarboxylase
MLEIMVQKGARTDLGRPKTSPIENKTAFTEFLSH